MRTVIISVLAVLAGCATATAKSSVTVKLLGTLPGKPPVTVYKVKFTLKNDSKRARWFALPPRVGMPMNERVTATARERFAFKEAKSVFFYRYYGGVSALVVPVPAKGSLTLEGWRLDSFAKKPSFEVWELDKLTFAGQSVPVSTFAKRHVHIRNANDTLLISGSNVRPPKKVRLHIRTRFKLSLKK